MRLALAAAGLALLAAGCAGTPQTSRLGLRPHCGVQGTVLELNGFTGPEMLACVTAADLGGVETIVLDSSGGPVVEALQIAEYLAPLHAEMVVRDRCHSSCANYFLPLGRSIRLMPGAGVILHGSVDAHLVSRGAPQAVADAQSAFAARHGIRAGWLMTRDADDGPESYGDHLSGAAQTWPEDGGAAEIAYIAVEEAMMRSCLPDIEIAPFIDTATQRVRADARLRERWRRQNTYPSGELRCVEPE